MKSLRLSALAAVLLLAACSTSAPTEPAQVGSPSFDGGSSLGSGNRDGGNTIGSGNDATQEGGVGTMGSGGGTTSSDTTGTQRGGGSLGSGN
jgi:hypothetical protein